MIGFIKSLSWIDLFIFIVAGGMIFLAILVDRYKKEAEINIVKWNKQKNIEFSKSTYKQLQLLHTMFTTIITIFPLLGMLGTVYALLTLDISSMSLSVQQNFFSALTSTAFGIVFAIAFKVVNAWFFYDIEDILDEIYDLSIKG